LNDKVDHLGIDAHELVKRGCGLGARKNTSSSIAQIADRGFPPLKDVLTISRGAPLRDGDIL
jgi:hypothetical protein